MNLTSYIYINQLNMYMYEKKITCKKYKLWKYGSADGSLIQIHPNP